MVRLQSLRHMPVTLFFCPAMIFSCSRFALPLLSNVLKKKKEIQLRKPFVSFSSFVFSCFLFLFTFQLINPKYDVSEGALQLIKS